MRIDADNYGSFHTWAEIVSQGEVWQAVLDELSRCATVERIVQETTTPRNWIFIGCGSSYYLAEAAAATWAALTGQPARAVPASEVILFPDVLLPESKHSQAVAISRSGQTSETVRAARLLKQELGIPTIGISCVRDSDLEKACNTTLTLHACDEKSVVMTRSFTSMLLALQFVAARTADNSAFITDLRKATERFGGQIGTAVRALQDFNQKHAFDDFVFLGQGGFYGIAREAALKVMEMSCSLSQVFHTLEFRHGPKAIVNPKTCLMFFLGSTSQEAESEVLKEMKQLGGTTIAVCDQASQKLRKVSDLVIETNLEANELALLVPFTVPGQICGFLNSVKKGLNPDEPRNLSRVVLLD